MLIVKRQQQFKHDERRGVGILRAKNAVRHCEIMRMSFDILRAKA